ncbi:hypothetical protein [Pyxidicoccus xibeiensis]|uniref:hypothetical protein n=1 Tax=Pyxidicoccus xibeiensis TaxID=2906759 RepID=UPI0020A71DE3|nr:hypothetical protein [Pyxidicoccus xibeiensis]MCP3137287.1 hypothetical protein [Pyxidicoccus xibeiensis]
MKSKQVGFGIAVWLLASGALAQEGEPGSGIITQLGLQLGYANGENIEGGEHGGPGARVQLLARFNRFVAAGPEVAYFLKAGSQTRVSQAPSGGENTESIPGGLMLLSGVLRLGFDDTAVRPNFLAGLALGNAGGEADTFYFLGGELAFMVNQFPLVVDVRYLGPLTGSSTGYPNYLTFGLGTRLSW